MRTAMSTGPKDHQTLVSEALAGESGEMWRRILEYAQSPAAKAEEAKHLAPAYPDYSVNMVTSAELVQVAVEWLPLVANVPERMRTQDGIEKWARGLARWINEDSGWLVRKYWKKVREDVLAYTPHWPTPRDLVECATDVARHAR